MEVESTTEVEQTNNEVSSDTDSSGTETVTHEAKDDQESRLEKALKDIQKLKAHNKDLEDRVESERVDKLKEQEKWQELSEEYRGRAEKSETRATTLEQSIIHDKKYSAVRDLATRAGLRKEALGDLELIPLDDVEIEVTSTGRINVLNAERAVDRLKSSRPHWFGRKTTTVNGAESEVVDTGGKVTYNDVLKAEEKAKENGDYAPYKSLLMKYKDQLRN